MRKRNVVSLAIAIVLAGGAPLQAFLEDICLPRNPAQGILGYCIRPTCELGPNRACPAQTADFATIKPGRSMVHHDSTYFIAQALGFRSDVAYWIAAYNEVADYGQYVPIDQCGVQAANENAIKLGNTDQTKPNSGRDYITAAFNGFVRTNANTDGPLDHYVVNFSPNGQGTDVHGAGGVQSLYPFHYPRPGYPIRIDDTYQKTLANLRQWAMLRSSEPGLLCTVGLTVAGSDGVQRCLTDATINASVPLIMKAPNVGVPINVPAGKKVLNYFVPQNNPNAKKITYYEELKTWLEEPARTTGKLWKSPVPEPVPVQLARMGLYLHVLQDTSSHATYCGDDAPSPPGGQDPGTYMYIDGNGDVQVKFGSSCASSPHLASHLQETGTGKNPLPLRDYVALNNTIDELIVFGNEVAKHHGWIVNPELLPPDTVGGKSAQGFSADDLKTTLVGKIVQGVPYSRAEVYQSGVITLPLQEKVALNRLHSMNRALSEYSATLRKQSREPSKFVALEHLPGNSGDAKDRSVCWR